MGRVIENVDGRVAGADHQRVVAGPALEKVVAVATVRDVVTKPGVDLIMPDITGYEVLCRLKAQPATNTAQ